LALKHAVRTPLELFWLKHPSMTLQWLLDLLDNTDVSSETSQDTAYDDMRNVDKLFEKGPVNTYREDCILAEIVFNEFYTWIEKNNSHGIIDAIPELLDQLGKFVKTQVMNYNITLQQDSVYYNLYITVFGVAMMKVLIQKAKLNDMNNGCEKDREACVIFTDSLQWVKELRKLDNKQCFYHFKLEEMTKFVLGETMTI
jgi:hypothetical protein